MDQAKAVINLKEGVIHLEGPVEFVRRYLDIYRSAPRGLEGTRETASVATGRRRAARGRGRRAKRLSCAGAIREEVKAGFFDEPRSTQEIKQQLTEKGITCTDNSVRVTLKRLSGTGLLDRAKEARVFRYHRKV